MINLKLVPIVNCNTSSDVVTTHPFNRSTFVSTLTAAMQSIMDVVVPGQEFVYIDAKFTIPAMA